MNTRISILFAISGLLLLACQKEDAIIDKVNNEDEDIFTAVVEDDFITKGDYTISGSTATFSWTSDDQFYRLVRNNAAAPYGNYKHFSYIYSSGSGNTVTFTGPSVGSGYSDSGYALTPANIQADLGYSNYNGSDTGFYLMLNESIPYDVDHPLKNIVPMLGVLEGTTYTFKPLTGVLAITLTNIPTTATSVVLSSTNKGLSGKSVRFSDKTDDTYKSDINKYLGPASHGLRQAWLPGTTKTYTFAANSFASNGNTATFYFPIGTSYNNSDVASPYTNFTVTVKADDTTLATVTKSGLSISLERAEIVVFPPINCNYVGTDISAEVTGSSDAIKAYYSTSKGTITSVRAAAITTKSRSALDAAIPNNTSGTDISSATDPASAVIVSSGFSTSGAYYIGVKAFNGTTEVGSFIVSDCLYYLNADDYTRFCKKHTDGTASNGSNTETWSEMTITFAACDKPKIGNIMVTEFDGMSYDAAPTHGARFYTVRGVDEGQTFSPGTPIRGRYTPALGFNTINLTFDSDNDVPFFTYGGNAYRITGGNPSGPTWNFCLNREVENYYIRNWNEPTYVRDITGTHGYIYSYYFKAYHYDSYGTY